MRRVAADDEAHGPRGRCQSRAIGGGIGRWTAVRTIGVDRKHLLRHAAGSRCRGLEQWRSARSWLSRTQQCLFNRLFRQYLSADSTARQYLAIPSERPPPKGRFTGDASAVTRDGKRVPRDITVTSENIIQDAADWQGLQYQCMGHEQMATVLVGFVFAALVEESPTDVERLINFAPKATPSDGYHPKKFGGNKLVLIPSLNDIDTLDDPGIQWFLTLVAVIDQVRMALMVISFLFLLKALLRFFYVDMLLTNSGNRHFFRAFTGMVTRECDNFHYGMFCMLFCLPLYTFKHFGLYTFKHFGLSGHLSVPSCLPGPSPTLPGIGRTVPPQSMGCSRRSRTPHR